MGNNIIINDMEFPEHAGHLSVVKWTRVLREEGLALSMPGEELQRVRCRDKPYHSRCEWFQVVVYQPNPHP